MGLFKAITNAATNLVQTVVTGVTNLSQNALPAVSQAVNSLVTTVTPMVTNIVNSKAAQGLAAGASGIAGGKTLSPEAVKAIANSPESGGSGVTGGGKGNYATGGYGYDKQLTGIRLFFNYYKETDGFYIVEADMTTRVLNWPKIAGHGLTVLTLGVITFKVGKKKRWF